MLGKGYRYIIMIMITIILSLCYSTWQGYRMTATYTQQIDTTMEFKISATEAHLWLKETLSGDSNEHIETVWVMMNDAGNYLHALVKGDKIHGMVTPRLTEPKMITAVKELELVFHQWQEIAHQRFEQSHITSAVGTDIDQKFDLMLRDIGNKTDHIEQMLHDEIASSLRGFLIIQFMLIIISMILFIALIKSLRSKDKDNIVQFEKIKHQEKNLSTTLNSIGDAVIVADSDGNISRMNPIAEKLTGWTLTEALDKPFAEIFNILDAQTREIADNPINKVFSTGKNTELAKYTLLIGRDGSEYRISDSAAPIFSDMNKTIGVVLVFRDITKELQNQEQMNHHNKMNAIGQLAGGVAHDFNNMLTAIMGAAQLLNLPQRNIDEKGKKYVDMILSSSSRAADLTAKLLAFGRKGAILSSAIDVHCIINDCIAIFNQTFDKNISISNNNFAESHLIVGDNTALQNVLMNLGINASQAMPDGGEIIVETNNIDFDLFYCKTSPFDLKPGKYLDIEFQDTGQGIAPEHRNQIFEPFFTTKEKGKGTGLGLASVYGTVQDHGGAITFYSEVGTGTVFHIYLPCTGDSVEIKQIAAPISKGTGQCILLVDDEEIIRIVTKHMLEENGYKILLASNGKQAVEVFQQLHSKIDLVIMDMIMPEMNGRDAFDKMKKVDNNCNIILASGFSKKEIVDEMIKSGLAGFLKKPYRLNELIQMVSKVLNC